MKDLASRLKADPTDWLLGEDNPSVRYLALRDLLGKGEDDPDVREAKRQIMLTGVVPKVLEKQEPGGHWGAPEHFYQNSKYKGTVWNLILLAELCADPADERIRNACEFVLRWSQHRPSGGFSYKGTDRNGGNRTVFSCLTANMLFALVRLGYAKDERVAKGFEWISRYQRFDLLPYPKKEWPYQYDLCWRNHTCRSGAVKALKAIAEVPEDERTPGMRRKAEEGAEFLLAQRIFYRPPELKDISRKNWLEFGFPLMWNTDLVEILGILGRLGVRDERMDEAIEIVLSKQGENGLWKQENHFSGRFITTVETNGKDSKWVTLNALRALRSFYPPVAKNN
ncbi:MAG: nitrogen fixation protein NifH [Methanomassiliicoccales archaeon]